jgi:thiamine-phosphate diphosphorylase/hydroxyethylthiazole kinase
MSHDGNEAEDLASLGGSLVINMGTTNAHSLNNFLKALNAYNKQGGPVLLDPVGAGATRMRRQAVKDLLAGGYFDFMKGNENEIQTLWGTSMSQQRGVDSDNKLSLEQKAHLVKNLAARERNVVIMTGEADLISDGERTFLIRNGHPLLGTVTGTGCTLGATIASYAVVGKEDKLVAAVAGILHFEIAAERAARRTDVQGPGSFIPIFIDSLQGLASLAASGDSSWLAEARVAVMK